MPKLGWIPDWTPAKKLTLRVIDAVDSDPLPDEKRWTIGPGYFSGPPITEAIELCPASEAKAARAERDRAREAARAEATSGEIHYRRCQKAEADAERLTEAAALTVERFKKTRGPWLDPSYLPLAEAIAALDDHLSDEDEKPT